MTQYTSRITSKGQVTIPKEVRERYGFEEGEYLILEPKGEDLVVCRGRIVVEEEGFETLRDRIMDRFEEKGIGPTHKHL